MFVPCLARASENNNAQTTPLCTRHFKYSPLCLSLPRIVRTHADSCLTDMEERSERSSLNLSIRIVSGGLSQDRRHSVARRATGMEAIDMSMFHPPSSGALCSLLAKHSIVSSSLIQTADYMQAVDDFLVARSAAGLSLVFQRSLTGIEMWGRL